MRPLRDTLHSPDLRKAQLAFGVLWASEWAFQVALSVIAFRGGGAAAVGLVAALRMLPGALLAPLATAVADRLPRDRVLIAAGLTRAAVTAAATATLVAGAPMALTYALAVIATAAFTVVRPAHSALLPALSRSPQELTASTVVRGLMDSAGTLIGPAVAAAVIAVASPDAVVGLVAAASAWAAALVALVVYEPPPREPVVRRHLLREAADGFAAMARDGDARLVAGLAVAQTFVRGFLGVLIVVLAIDELGAGDAAVGWLTAAIGAGAVIGSLGASRLADGRDLARWEGAGVALWGLPLLACAAVPALAPALVFLLLVGIGNALVDVGLFTLPVRLVPDERLGRFFGVFESLACVAVAAGSLAAPLAIDAFGVRGALAAVGLVGPVVVVLAWPQLTRIDRTMVARDSVVAVLRSSALLRPLPVPTIERLANRSALVDAPAGTVVVRKGAKGDAFYVIATGRAVVSHGKRKIRTLGAGDSFGEIALLRPVRRTATVTAVSHLTLQTITRDDFLIAITGYRPSASEAEQRVSSLAAADAARG